MPGWLRSEVQKGLETVEAPTLPSPHFEPKFRPGAVREYK